MSDDTTRFLFGAAYRDEGRIIRGYLAVPAIGVRFTACGSLLGPWPPVAALATGTRIGRGRRARRPLPHGCGPRVLSATAGAIALFFVLCKFTAKLSGGSRCYCEYGSASRGAGIAPKEEL